MTGRINLGDIFTKYDLDVKAIAKGLFPDMKYPELALRRVIQGKGDLSSEQFSKLSFITGIPLDKLFNLADWKARMSETRIHIFTNGEYTAELDVATWITKLSKNDTLFHEFVLASGTVTLSEYLRELDRLISRSKS